MTAPAWLRARRGRKASTMAAMAAALLAAGCGSTGPAPAAAAPLATPAVSLNTSLATAAGTWAVVVMGGSAAQNNNFWQLFARPAGAAAWQLVTPPGTADNGGLVLAAGAAQSLITAFRPSQGLTYTPLIETGDSGRAWFSLNPLDAELASTPDSLAIQPGSARLLALTASGTAELAAPGYTAWTALASERSLAATPAGRRCRLQALTAAAFSSSGTPLLAGSCARPGTAAVFAFAGGGWQPAGPPVPAALAGDPVTVLRLTQTPGGLAALLEAGTSLVAAWSTGDGGQWTVSAPLRVGSLPPASASFGPGGTAGIVLPGGRGETVSPGGPWQALPALPAGTAALVPGDGGTASALAVHSTKLTAWQLSAGAAEWEKTQVISVPIQFGSSS
jgi:hypothetical protein